LEYIRYWNRHQVLSVAKALSIQAHPDKKLAESLARCTRCGRPSTGM
jgi:mannose-6-phosphate isomerase class I